MSEENKTIHRSIWEEIWNQGNLNLADEIYDSNHISHGQGIELPPGPEGLKTLISIYRAAFPDVHFTVEDQIAEGDKVVTRWTSLGTHKGEFLGIEATGNEIRLGGIYIYRIADGKIAEVWTSMDLLGTVLQLGPSAAADGD